MKRLKYLAIGVVAMTIGALLAGNSIAQDRSSWTGGDVKRIGSGLAVKGGTDVLEKAVAAIVPAPYTIKIDAAVPRTLVLSWADQTDWMVALRQAVAPMQLRVVPNWSENAIYIAMATPTATPALAATAVAAPIAAISPSTVVAGPISAVASPANIKTWRILSEDIRLSSTLDRWTKEAGYNLVWDAQKQVLLSAKDSFSGTLEEALQRVLSSPAIRKSDYPLEACFYPNQPPVIRITRLGEQTEECPL